MTSRRRVALALLSLVAGSATRAQTPSAPIAVPRTCAEVPALSIAGSARDALAYVRARSAFMRTLDPAQIDERRIVTDGSLARTVARAVPDACAHRYLPGALAEGRVLGLVTANGDFPLFGLRAGDTAYVVSHVAPRANASVAARLLVVRARGRGAEWKDVSIEYHPEATRGWDKAYSQFMLIPMRAAHATSARSVYALASYAAAAQDSTQSGNSSVWISCLAGCCRVKTTR